MKKISIGIKDAQKLMFTSQKLVGPKLEALEIIEHLGYIQLDTISVVERAHHHVFWTRDNTYKPQQLDDMMKNREVFEYWSHAASILPMRDFRYSLPMKKSFKTKTNSWFPRDEKLMKKVMTRIKKEGPLQSRDFESGTNTNRNSGWWEWKPAKKALERLFLEGSLEVSYRDKFKKVYDIPENIIPSSINTKMPSKKEYHRFLIQRLLKSHGIISIDEVAYLRNKFEKADIKKELELMLKEEILWKVKVGDIDTEYFSAPNPLNSLVKFATSVSILSPFDNLVIQRAKLKNIFKFDYQIECYVPEKKRKYGYFCLPIFKGYKAIGRIDCKADRKEKKLIIKSVHSETAIDLKNIIKPKVNAFAKFNSCNSVLWVE